MTFSEEVPADFKPRCDCKRRNCPLQDYYLDRAHGNKRFFLYRCSDPKIWAGCLRHLEVSEKPAKATVPEQPVQQPKQPAQEPPKPAETPKPQPNSDPHKHLKEALKEPTKQQSEHRCNQYPYDCHLCAPAQQDKCGVEPENRRAL